ncbi:hypothetical protein [Pandoraea apista]|uniref:hypothetical protein n=1 Tax=Pandoraea apista TaxID=93218 RepID=UPI002F93C2FB
MPDNKTVTFDALIEFLKHTRSNHEKSIAARDPVIAAHIKDIGEWIDALAAAPTSAAQSAGQEAVAWPILKGIGRINGDGWKDTTKVGQIVYVWNAEMPAPYMAGQYPRIGNEGWSASTKQYDFTPATVEEIRDLFAANAAPVNVGERELGQVIDERDQYHDAAEKLADAIAKHFGVEIGEHSNLNCPWQNALDHIAQATKRAADAQPSDMNGGVYMSFAADEIERRRARVALLERRADTSLIPGAEPTHRCKVCGAYWRKWNVDGETSWNLNSRGCGECCDNVAMGDQIEPLASPAKVGGDGLIEQHHRDSAELRRLCEARDQARRTAEHWKAEHLAGNAEIKRLKKLLDAKVCGDEREAFEAWAREAYDCDDDGDVLRRDITDYVYSGVSDAWAGWQARAAPTSPAKVPDAVMQALDRMSTPLHDSRLSGLTAELDAANIKTIRDYVLSGAVPAKVVGDDQHPDDAAVDRFSVAMKAKLAKKRAQGRGGWDDERVCSPDDLARMLVDHVRKGDPVDVGNLAMMLFNRPDTGAALCRAALSADGGERKDAERLDFMIEQQAWVQWTVRDGSIRQCQVYTQDEDENYHILPGEDQFFSTPRKAIDAAIATKPSGKGGE